VDTQLVRLEHLLGELGSGEQRFVERYPGAFMVAAGLLVAEESKPKPDDGPLVIEATKPPRESTNGRLDFTSVFRFGQKVRHATGEPHALAGCAFFLRPTGEKTHVEVGRSAACDITVPDSSVSDRHCRIEVTGQGVVVRDLASTNGTSINQQRIEPDTPRVLADEDILSVGRYSFQILSAATLFAGLIEVRPLLKR